MTSNYATNRFVYDGWNLIAELDHQSNPLRSYAWGQDLSGTMDKAGGVGGLLLVKDHAGSTTHFAGYDGNGNVTTLIKSDGSVSARYEYSPFGEPLRVTGSAARLNPFRWSTKFTDEESGLVYYGYRYYSPMVGRWVNRDPIGENGGKNLYAFVRSNPQSRFDSLGESEFRIDVTKVGTDIHDTVDGVNINYGIGLDGNGEPIWYERGGKHAGQAPTKQVQKSIADIMSDPKKLKTWHNKITGLHDGGAWPESFRDSPNGERLRITGGSLRRLTAGTGMALGFLAIMQVASASEEMASVARDYGRFMNDGDTAMADLSAIELAINVQDMGGNYFVTMYALDILLNE